MLGTCYILGRVSNHVHPSRLSYFFREDVVLLCHSFTLLYFTLLYFTLLLLLRRKSLLPTLFVSPVRACSKLRHANFC